jgi:hypothetical protein
MIQSMRLREGESLEVLRESERDGHHVERKAGITE